MRHTAQIPYCGPILRVKMPANFIGFGLSVKIFFVTFWGRDIVQNKWHLAESFSMKSDCPPNPRKFAPLKVPRYIAVPHATVPAVAKHM